MSARLHVLDADARRSRDGRLLTGGAPARQLRLSAAGAAALDAALAGAPASPRLVGRLVEAGLLHPAGAPAPAVARSLSFVVPVRDSARWLPHVVEALLPHGEVTVVDDGSTDDSARLARAAGARVIANAQPTGPGGARNTGLRPATTELVGFVDVDVRLADGWLDHLLGLFDDPRLGAAAPRVASVPGASALARYELACSPLDLGADPGLVGPGRRIPYVPSAAFVARRSALEQVGGFDPALRAGEDVDLVWRLVAAGWAVRYAPESVVAHHPRPTVRELARQRFVYGGSAAPLEQRHPRVAAPLHVAPQTAAVWLAAGAAGPAAGALAYAAATLPAARRVNGAAARAHVVALSARGHLLATRHLTRVLVREWLPLTACACLASRRARRLALAAFALDALAAPRARARVGLVPYTALRAVDVAAYAAGLWSGVWRARSPAALAVRRATR